MIKITRRQARAWLAPMRAALRAMRAGEVDAVRGYPVTRMNQRDDYVRIDFCIAGFRGLIERLEIAVDLTALATIEKRLAAGVLFTVASIDHALARLRQVEDALISFSPAAVKTAVLTEQVSIELESLGIKEAA